MKAFADEFRRLAGRHNPKVLVTIAEDERSWYVMENYNTPRCAQLLPHVIAQVSKSSLNVFSPYSMRPRGSLHNEYHGFDLIDWYGVITNQKRKAIRMAELVK